jgi:hypothetical protein
VQVETILEATGHPSSATSRTGNGNGEWVAGTTNQTLDQRCAELDVIVSDARRHVAVEDRLVALPMG